MLSQASRSSRCLMRASVRAQQVSVTRRTLVTTAPRQADMVQDMYLKELKAYKPPAEKPGEAEQHVQKFSMPKPPQSPEEADIQNDLKAYEDQVPEVEGQAASGESAPVQDWFEEPEEDDDETAHH